MLFLYGLSNGGRGLALVYSSETIVQFLSYESKVTATVDSSSTEDFATLEGESLRLAGKGTCYADFEWNEPSLSLPSYDSRKVEVGGLHDLY